MRSHGRYAAIDFARVVGAFLVITLHADPFRAGVNQFVHFFEFGVTRIAVPFFFVASGFFLFYTIKNGKFYNWAARLFKLYIVWMIIYSVFWLPGRVAGGGEYLVLKLAKDFLIGYYHLWFLSALVLASFLICYLFKWGGGRIGVSVTLSAALGFCFQYVYFYTDNEIYVRMVEAGMLNRSFLTFAFPYVGIGFLIASSNDFYSFLKRNSGFLMAFGVLALVIEVYLHKTFALRTALADNMVSIMILVPAIFIVTLKVEVPFVFFNRHLSSFSLGVYLVHIGVLELLRRFEFFMMEDPSFIWLSTCILSCFLAIVLILPKQPFRWIIS